MSFKFFVVHCRGAAPVAGAGVRAALRAAWTRRRLAPGGYAIVLLTVTGLGLAVLISASPAADELDNALPLSWWFV
jgi:hypothetical protein